MHYFILILSVPPCRDHGHVEGQTQFSGVSHAGEVMPARNSYVFLEHTTAGMGTCCYVDLYSAAFRLIHSNNEAALSWADMIDKKDIICFGGYVGAVVLHRQLHLFSQLSICKVT